MRLRLVLMSSVSHRVLSRTSVVDVPMLGRALFAAALRLNIEVRS
jgi:hypothetical protein